MDVAADYTVSNYIHNKATGELTFDYAFTSQRWRHHDAPYVEIKGSVKLRFHHPLLTAKL